MSQNIAPNIALLQQRMQAAARRAGRSAGDITLVAVTKTHALETVMAAYQVGLRHFGENRAQEYLDKATGLSAWLAANPTFSRANWHFIGHLQSRQVGTVLAGQPSLIHSVDSLKLAQRIDRLAKQEGYPPLRVLLQCNVSGEEAKSGFELNRWLSDRGQMQSFVAAIKQILALDKIIIQGLMTMAPFLDDPQESRPVFQSLAALRAELQTKIPQLDWPHLSMGMTDDFEVAIEEGATLIRVGRAIFGERTY